MALVIIIDILVIVLLLGTAVRKGIEECVPLATFLILIFPFESQISLPGLFDVTTQRVVLVALALGYLIGRDRGESTAALPLRFLLLTLVLWTAVATANSVEVIVSLKTMLSELFDFALLYYICIRSITKTETVNKVMIAIVAAMTLNSVFGLIEVYADCSVLSVFPTASHRFDGLVTVADRDVRAQSTFGHAILFGTALAMAIPAALYLLTIARNRAQKVCLWSAIALMFVNLYKTMSRGPWLAAVLGVGAALVLGGKQWRRYVGVIALLTVATLVLRPGVFDSVKNLYGETLDADTAQGASYQWRYALYDVAISHLNNDIRRALWGYGPESFYYLGWKGEFQGTTVPFESCDSSIAALMIETGYVGLMIVIALLAKASWSAYRGFQMQQGAHKSVCLVLLIDILIFAFLMTNAATFGWGQQSYLLWIILALAVSYSRLVRSEFAEAPSEEDHVVFPAIHEPQYLQSSAKAT